MKVEEKREGGRESGLAENEGKKRHRFISETDVKKESRIRDIRCHASFTN